MTRIYLSSTDRDLAEYRRAVYDALAKLRYDVFAVDGQGAADTQSADKRLSTVADCSIFIGIVAWRYGHVPPGETRSITELEYHAAGRHGLSRFVFVLDEDAAWPYRMIEDGEGAEKLKEWRKDLVAAHAVAFQSDPNDVASKVIATVAKWSREQLDGSIHALRQRHSAEAAERRKTQKIKNVVNVRPLDVGDAFRGRERETEALRSYLADPLVHMVSVLGRGGMGKTALATRVLADAEHGRIRAPGDSKDTTVDGIVYLTAQHNRITLERLFTDVARLFDDETADGVAARWANNAMSLAAKAEYLLEVAAAGTYIILLDNLEDELEPDGTIRDEGLRVFVEQCQIKPSGIKLLVTSREKVKLSPAALRATRTISLSHGLAKKEAVALLRDLDPQGMLNLKDAAEKTLMRAVELTRGIPRALELLAGLLYEDPTTHLDQLLADKAYFGAEVMGPLVAAGYQRLAEPERRIMEALSIFNDQVDEAAIAYLVQPWWPGLDVDQVQNSLRRLVNGHFVQVNAETHQYSLHALDQEYAYHQIPAAS